MHSRQYNIPARLSMEVDEEDVWTGIISTSSLAASVDRRNPDSLISDNLNTGWIPSRRLHVSFLFASDQHGQRKIPDFLSSRQLLLPEFGPLWKSSFVLLSPTARLPNMHPPATAGMNIKNIKNINHRMSMEIEEPIFCKKLHVEQIVRVQLG